MAVLLIRTAQIRALRITPNEEFDQLLERHLRAIWPDRYEQLSSAGTRLSTACREKANDLGMWRSTDVTRLAEVMLFLGRDFDEHPELEWAREVLDGALSPSMKAAKLCAALDAWLDDRGSDHGV